MNHAFLIDISRLAIESCWFAFSWAEFPRNPKSLVQLDKLSTHGDNFFLWLHTLEVNIQLRQLQNYKAKTSASYQRRALRLSGAS